jgi:predicted DNA-binding transcriptional regulator AlpA
MEKKNKRWLFNERIDDEIRRIYSNGSRGGGRETLAAFAKRIGYPYCTVQQRAGYLGLSKPYDARHPWSQREEEILRRNAHHSYKEIHRRLKAAGFDRSVIAVQRKTTNAHSKLYVELMSGEQVAQCFGVSSTTVYRWIKNGFLKAQVKDNHEHSHRLPSPQRHYLIHDNSIRDFVRRHPMEFDLRRVDQLWFLNLVFKDRLGEKVAA